jgi:AcrR family transcriptional regulator
MGPETELTGKRRGQIIEAAMKVFSEKGFDKARVDDIVDESGLSKGAVYWYFKSKDEIIQAAFDQFFDFDQQGLQLLVDQPGTTRERLRAYSLMMVQNVVQINSLLPLAYQFYAAATRQSLMQESFQRYFQTYNDLLSKLLRQGIERGELKLMNEQAVATQLMALMEGMILLWVLQGSTFDAEAFVRDMINTLFDGLAVESGMT